MHVDHLSPAAVAILLCSTFGTLAEEGAAPHSSEAPEPDLPTISAVVDIQATSTDMDNDPNDNKVRIREAEIGAQGYLDPSVRGNLIVALEQEYAVDGSTETDVHIEEAYVSLLDLPGGLYSHIGRKLMGFGRLTPVHRHHWAVADMPLALGNFFGEHPWLDDGVEIGYLVPNPFGIYLKLSAGAWNGSALGHVHAHEEEDHDEHEEDVVHEDDDHEEDHEGQHGDAIDWDGHVFTGRVFADLPLSDSLNAQLGYSVAGDEGENVLHGADLVLRLRCPETDRLVKWHTECFAFEGEDSSPYGLFSLLQVTLDEQWAVGGRYDWTELLHDDGEDTWAGTGFVSYHLTHTTYVRGQYQHREHADGETEHTV
ncbi:MAG: hypothetical protein QGH74_09870, partial [Candidatus Brocadiia bacterium]|nr:hypothetical protein [Candidatus Brocadiia bacterium]